MSRIFQRRSYFLLLGLLATMMLGALQSEVNAARIPHFRTPPTMDEIQGLVATLNQKLAIATRSNKPMQTHRVMVEAFPGDTTQIVLSRQRNQGFNTPRTYYQPLDLDRAKVFLEAKIDTKARRIRLQGNEVLNQGYPIVDPKPLRYQKWKNLTVGRVETPRHRTDQMIQPPQ